MAIAKTETIVDANGAKLHVLLDGQQGAPWVVLIHALGTNSSLFDGQIAALAQDFRILRYDMRGHGKSSSPPGPYSIDLLTSDLVSLFARFQIPRAQVVGVSLGALTALAAAQRSPSQIRSIVFCNARLDLTPDFIKMIDDRNHIVRQHGMDAIANEMAARWLTAPTIRTKTDVALRVAEMVRTTSAQGYIACAEAIKGHRLADRIGTVKMPTLFIGGDQDPGLPKELMHRMITLVPGSEFSVMIGASHLSNVDQPTSFNAVLGAFLRKHR
jgi:3-oxoadipate enol-lactonase